MGKRSFRRGMNKFLTVLLSVAMVTTSVPAEAYSAEATAATTAATTASAAVSSAATSAAATVAAATAKTEVDVALTFDHAYITVAGQDVASPSTKVTVTANEDLKFTAAADEGYDLDNISYKLAGATSDDDAVELTADEDGVYTLPASAAVAGTEIEVSGVEQAATPADASAATSLTSESDVSTQAEDAPLVVASAAAVQSASEPVAIGDDNADVTAVLTVNGEPLTSETKIGHDDTIHAAINVDYHSATCPTKDSLDYTYAFPDGILVNDMAATTLYDDNGNVAGTYSIENGKVHFTYNESWIVAHPNNVKTYFSFDFTVDKSASDGKDEIDIKFPGTGTTVPIHFTDGKVTGSKSATLNDDGTVSFTVGFNADTTVKDFQFVDTMGENLSFDADSFLLDNNKLAVTVDGQTATSAKLETLTSGSHTLTYKAHLSDAAKTKLANGEQLSATDNEVDWSWTGGTGSAKTTVNFSNVLIDKSAGKLDANTGYINWHVRLNQGTPKVNMAGYVFTDELTTTGQSYVGSYKITDVATGKVVYTGTLDSSKDSFTYTFPDDAGEKEYTIEYSTKMDNPSMLQTYWNKATIEHDGNSKSDSDKYQNIGTGVDTDYVQKDIVTNDATGTGKVDWKSTIHAATIGSTTFTFFDDMTNSNSHIWFVDGQMPVVTTAAGVTLKEGDDYTYSVWNKTMSDGTSHGWRFYLQFKDSATMKEAIKGDIYVTYSTMCDKTSGTYKNYSNIQQNGITKYDEKEYTIDQTPTVTKSDNNSTTWDANVANGDGTKGAYVTTWSIVVNQNKDNWAFGIADLMGQTLTTTDNLPAGMHYIEGSAGYDAWTNGNDSKCCSWGNSITPTVTKATSTDTGDTLSFVAPSASILDSIKQSDGTAKAVVRIYFKTRIDNTAINVGGDTTFTNDATASTGSVDFGKTTDDVTVNDKVIDKQGQKNNTTGLVDYTINVNTNAHDLVPDKDTLTLTDNLDSHTSFVPTSFKVTSGGTDVTDLCTDYVTKDETTGKSVLTVTLPDSMALTITYSVRTNWAIGTEQDITNTASLAGISKGTSSTTNKVTATNATAGASASAGTVTVTKAVYGHSTQTLEGATFELYRVDGWTDDGTAKTTLANTLTTGKDGTVTFTDSTIGTDGTASTSLKSNTLYYYVETKAPEGYKLDSTKHYVMLDDTTDGSHSEAFNTALAEVQAHGINANSVNSTTTDTVYDVKLTASAQFSATKELTGATLTDKTYSFELKDASGMVLQTKYANADGTITFDQIDYGTADIGKHTYTISEVAGDKAGVTYDTTVHTVTVDVEKGDNELTATTTYDGGAPVFKNSYSAKGSVSFSATKSLDGATLTADQFSFALEQTDENGKVLSDGYKQTVKNGGDGAATVADVKFSDIDYTQEDAGKTFYYTISEVIPEGAKDAGNSTWTNAGYTYDGHRVSVKVEVTDKGDGTLGITRTYDDAATAPSFSNKYVASGDVTLTASKMLTGHALANDQFEFELKDANGGADNGTVLQTKKNTDQGLVTFDKITYTTPGTYHYTISEKAGEAGKGYTYDAKVSNVTVEVSDNGKGQLEAVPSYDVNAEGAGTATAPTFANTYTATGSTKLKATKTLTGDGATLTAKEFSFTVKDANGTTVATGTNDANGDVTFSAIKYTQADAGKTYTYKVSEVADAAAGMTYDKTIYTATVKVSDNNDGTLSTAVTYTKDDGTEGGTALAEGEVPAFENTYAPTSTSVRLAASKALANATDKTTLAAGEFNFQVTDASGSSVASGTNDASGNVTFSKIDFAKAGTYTYTISEVVPDEAANNGNVANGITYDATTYKATVVVSDHAGTLQVDSVTYARADGSALDDGATVPAFENTYAASGSVVLTATKALAGPDAVLVANEFSFTAKDANGSTVATGTNGADGKVTFSAIKYTQADLGEHVYTISEVIPADDDKVPGVTYDEKSYKVTVTVSDEGDGKLGVEVVYDGGAAPTFTNTYAATGTYTPSVKKAVTGTTATDKTFDFALAANDDANAAGVTSPMPATTTASAVNGATATFGTITYSAAGTYNYTITETTASGDGYTCDTTAHALVVTVTDPSHDGTFTVTATYDGTAVTADAPATITNTYAATGSWTPSATKTLTGATLAADEFSFTLKDSEGTMIGTAKNAADGAVAFTAIDYALADAGKTFTYTITEDAGTVAGVTYDATTKTVYVKVADEGNGTLSATAYSDSACTVPLTAADTTFTNTYFGAKAGLSATKYYYGADANKTFDFTLTATDGSFVTRSDGASTTYTSADSIVDSGQPFSVTLHNESFVDDAADVVFPDITYYEPGTYYYTLAETTASDSGTTCDDAVYDITVTVAADGTVTRSYELESDGSTTADGATFYNNANVSLSGRSMSYASTLSDAGSVSVDPVVYKELQGRSLQAGEFSFTLKDADGKVLQTKTNDADGRVAFGSVGSDVDESGLLTFDKAGTYVYTITEDAGTDQTVSYDDKTITLTVTVTKNVDGTLSASTTYQASDSSQVTDAPTFVNKVKTIDIRVRKTSKSDGEGLAGATYGLWMVNEGGNDVYIRSAESDADGYITFEDVALQNGAKYYFKEEKAPSGHLVDPYRSDEFTFSSENGKYSISYDNAQ